MSGLAAEKIPETQSVIQYWICQPVSARSENHTYYIEGKFYTIIAYCHDYKTAKGILGNNQERGIAEVEVFDYEETMRLAHKENFEFLGWKIQPKIKAPI